MGAQWEQGTLLRKVQRRVQRDLAQSRETIASGKSQLPVIKRALETAGLMLGSNKSRGYSLEMICADFLAGANLPQTLGMSLERPIQTLSKPQQAEQLESLKEDSCRDCDRSSLG
jgi:hypothetical protein